MLYWKYSAATRAFSGIIQEWLGQNISTDLPFGASVFSSGPMAFGTAHIVFSDANLVDKPMYAAKLRVWPTGQLDWGYVDPIWNYGYMATEQGFSTVYYPDDLNTMPWWVGYVPNGNSSSYPYSTNSAQETFVKWQVPVSGGPSFFSPLYEFSWSGIGMYYVPYYHEIVVAVSSGVYD